MKTPFINHKPAAPLQIPARITEPMEHHPCDTSRFSPFGFRIKARPGRQPRLVQRGLRRRGTADFLQAMTHS